MQLVQVFGASGSGVSTVARLLARVDGTCWRDLDSLHWLDTEPPYTQLRDPSEKRALLEHDLQGERVILAGSLAGWADDLARRVSVAVWLTASNEKRAARIQCRERVRFGSRIDAGGDMFERSQAFIRWAEKYEYLPAEDARSMLADRSWFNQICCPKFKISTDNLTADQIAIQILENVYRQ